MADVKTSNEDPVSDLSLLDMIRVALFGGGNAKATFGQVRDVVGVPTIDTDGTLAANSDAIVASQKATKTYVDTKVAGLSWKQAVRAATTANGTLATAFENGGSIDGVTLATGDRILIKNQSSAAENGIYVVNASGAPTRSTDADSGAELVDAAVYVSEGTTLADTQWTCSTNAPITIGVTSLTFAQVSAGSVAIGSVTGMASGAATFLTTASSANLASLLTDETGSGAAVFATSPTLVTPALGTPASGNMSNCTADGTDAVGFRNIPQNSKSAAYTTVLADAGKHILHPSGDANARTFTIDSNANVAYPIGTAITFINQTSQVVTIAITSDTMTLANSTTTGSRSLAQNGIATAIKIASTSWIISGTGLT